MSPKRQLRVCKACKAGTCSECSNWMDRSDWCEHPCAEEPKQLGLFPKSIGWKMAHYAGSKPLQPGPDGGDLPDRSGTSTG